MGDRINSSSMDDLPFHLILEILISGRLSAMDLVCLELTSRTFWGSHGLIPQKFRSLVDFAAFRLCGSHPIYSSLRDTARNELYNRCKGNWKRVLRFLQYVEQSSHMVQTSTGSFQQMQIKSGRYHTLLINDLGVYSCGSSLCGVLGHGPEITQCVSFMPISFPVRAQVIQVSASHNHAAFVTQSGEVFTCGDNSSFCCGHRDTARPIFKPKLVEALKGIPCKQVAAGLSFTMFLASEGHLYTCGTNTQGQLGHGDTQDRPTPQKVEHLESIVQIAAGPSYSLAVAADGTLFSFGSGTNFCLGNAEQHNELRPRAVISLKRQGIHVVQVSAGDEHVVALDSNGQVYTWGKGYCGALGHGDEIDKTIPLHLAFLKFYLAVQVCASKRKTFVLVDDGTLYGFGWMGFGSLGFLDRAASEKVVRPQILDSLRKHRISQVSTGLYHTVVITNEGRVLGFGDNERAQLGHDSLRTCLQPTEIFIG